MNDVKFYEKTIQNLKFELFTNDNKKSWQKIVVSNVETGKSQYGFQIAPVDLFTVVNALNFQDTIDGVLSDFKDTWTFEVLEFIVKDVI